MNMYYSDIFQALGKSERQRFEVGHAHGQVFLRSARKPSRLVFL